MICLISGIAGKGHERAVLIAYLLDGLCKLLGADKWVRTFPQALGSKGRGGDPAVLHGGFSEVEIADWSASAAQPSADVFEAFFRSRRSDGDGHLTQRLEDYKPHAIWRSSPSGLLATRAGTGTFIRNSSPADGAGRSCTITLYRIPGALPFTARDRHVAHLLLSEVGWLHDCVWTDLRSPVVVGALRKSLLPVISMLLGGASRQEVSDRMGIKINTVNSYMKEIYRHYGVHSQLELIRVVRQGRADPLK